MLAIAAATVAACTASATFASNDDQKKTTEVNYACCDEIFFVRL